MTIFWNLPCGRTRAKSSRHVVSFVGLSVLIILFIVTFKIIQPYNYYNDVTVEKNIVKNINHFVKNNVTSQSKGLYRYKTIYTTEDKEDVDALKASLDAIEELAPLSAPGEMGVPVMINMSELTKEEREQYESGYKRFGYRDLVSDMISTRRRLEDKRIEPCKKSEYKRPLPDTSVIICFHNEAWSVLLRTVFSVLDRSPPRLIAEIILVDDFSDHDLLMEPLDDYLKSLEKVTLIRTTKREGLTRARLLGAEVAIGTVLTFLDAHCECYPGWLEPILARIAEDTTRVVCPVIEVLHTETFYPEFVNTTEVGVFDIKELKFARRAKRFIKLAETNSPTDPVRTPAMVGGLFSISRDYFNEVGRFDPDLVLGMENLELSFKIWMCGGSLEIHPCSHVAHLYRREFSYSWPKPTKDLLRRNGMRLAEVWLDDYKHYYYRHKGYSLHDDVDVSERKALRQRLKCKSFDWFIQNIFPELNIPSKFSGEVRNEALDVCINGTTALLIEMNVGSCGGQDRHSTILEMKEKGEVHGRSGCVTGYVNENKVTMETCSGQPSQLWEYTLDKSLRIKSTNSCLDVEIDRKLRLSTCSNNLTQKWKLNQLTT